jgi:hypothetical protein
LNFLPQPYGAAQSIMMKRTLTKQPYGAVEFFTATLRGCIKEQLLFYNEAVIPLKLL